MTGMSLRRWRRARVRRRIKRVVLAWLGLQGLLAGAGWLAAQRLDEGNERSARIRRVRAVAGFELRPTNPALSSVQLDVGMGGAELDLTGIGRPATPVEVSLNVVMGGVGVKVPPDWRVWWSFAGVGGMDSEGGLQRVTDEHEADLRVRARVLFGGVGIAPGS
jgi:hypothetical protein